MVVGRPFGKAGSRIVGPGHEGIVELVPVAHGRRALFRIQTRRNGSRRLRAEIAEHFMLFGKRFGRRREHSAEGVDVSVVRRVVERRIVRVEDIRYRRIRCRDRIVAGRDFGDVGSREVDGRSHVILTERLLDGGGKNLKDKLLVLELDFVFLRMDIDVDALRVDLETDEIVGLRVGRDEILVAIENGAMEVRMLHVAAVDKEILQCVAAPGSHGKTDEARDSDDGG